MKGLFAQTWLLMLLSFLAGALLTWLALIRPWQKLAARADKPAVTDEPAAVEDEPVEAEAPAAAEPVAVEPSGVAEAFARPAVQPEVAEADRAEPRRAEAERAEPERAEAGPPGAAAGERASMESPYGPGSAAARTDGSAPSGAYVIKGNASSMLYHTTDSPYFTRTNADVWFRTPEDAEAAGFTAWNRRRAQFRAITDPVYEEGPYPGSARPAKGGAAPTEEFTIKGNEESMLYHTRESPYYGATRAEVWFRSEADAQRAGFAAWRTKTETSAR